MKTSNKVLATHMEHHERKPISLPTILFLVAFLTFVILGGIFVVISLTATTTPPPGRIIVDIHDMQQFKTAAPVQ